jgi:hypothetical protein
MLRSIFIALAVAASLFAWSLLGELPVGALARAGGGVTIGVLTSAIAFGDVTWFTVAAGALSPLAFAAIASQSAGLATAAMCVLWLAPRFVLAETRRMLAILVTGTTIACLVGGFVFAANVDVPLLARIASCVFAGSCLALVGILVPVDTTVGWALKTAAAVISTPVRAALERAARVHHRASSLPRARAKRDAWRSLAQLADRRAAMEHLEGRDADESKRELDERISTQASELAPEESSTSIASPMPTTTVPTEPEITVVDDPTPVQPTLPGLERETAEP